MNDGDEKKDLEGGEKDDITYADLDDNALSSGIKHIVTNQSIPIICNNIRNIIVTIKHLYVIIFAGNRKSSLTVENEQTEYAEIKPSH